MSTVIFPYAYIPDPTKGKPISNGQLFFGLPDLDPEIEANRITIGIQQEDGTIVNIAPASQPILTGAGGVPLYNGSPVIIVIDPSISEYSIKVLDKNDAQVYYNENASALVNVDEVRELVGVFDNLDEAKDYDGSVGEFVETNEYNAGTSIGGAKYIIVSSAPSYLGTLNHAMSNGLYLEIIPTLGMITLSQAGCVGGSDETANAQDAFDYGSDNLVPINSDLSINANITINGTTIWHGNEHSITPVSNAPVVTIDAGANRVDIEHILMNLGGVSRAWTECDGVRVIGQGGTEDYSNFKNVIIRSAPAYGFYAFGSDTSGDTVQRLHCDSCTFVDSEYANLRLEGVCLEIQFSGCFFNDGCKLGALPNINDQLTHPASPAREFRRASVELLRWYTAADTATNDFTPNRVAFYGCNFASTTDWDTGNPLKRVGCVYISGGQSITFDTCNFEKPYPALWLAKEDGTGANFKSSSVGVKVDNCTFLSLSGDPYFDSNIIWDGYPLTTITNPFFKGSGAVTLPSLIYNNTGDFGGSMEINNNFSSVNNLTNGTVERASTAYSSTRLIANARYNAVVTGVNGVIVGKTSPAHTLNALTNVNNNEVINFIDGDEIYLSCDTSVNGSLTVVHNSDDGAGSPSPLDGRFFLSGLVNAVLDADYKKILLKFDSNDLVFYEVSRNF